ncbi:Na+/H+ antiporter [Chitinophaga sp.]|mgnify:CR=1 FL=1|uniref:Na+/H+ antiporter n=1 Tax=Chitinophaga sp. TaxID=1869181 RepID=UPI0026089A70|nr:Na+/H+ antiporter [uncultured Chitinophaga sp.]
MEHQFFLFILLVIFIQGLVMLSQKIRVAYPIVLLLGGLALCAVPGVPAIAIEPDYIFVIFLPPLLYEAAWYTSWKDLWRWRRIVGTFAFLMVIVTSLVVAWVSSSFLPGFTMALGFLLGGIVSPPDAVSATSVLKYVKVPKRLSAIIEGESLLNDASSLIVFRFALIAVDSGRFVFQEAAISFVVVIVMGILIGLAVAVMYYFLHKKLPTSANMDIVLTLTAPYVMYMTAETFHFSGVLAVVSGGLFLSYRSHQFLSATSRLRGSTVWSALAFVLNGLVFLLIGLEMPVIVRELGTVSIVSAIGYGVLITAVLIVTRLACTYFASVFTVFISRFITTADPSPGWKGPLIFGWAGMRGVVSLAAALSIPLHFPQRNLILFITFTVILLTLVVQGLTLPWLVKRLEMEDADHPAPVEDQDHAVREQLAAVAIRHLDGHYSRDLATNGPLQQLRSRYVAEAEAGGDVEGGDHVLYRKAALAVLEAQRRYLQELEARSFSTDDGVLRKYQGLLDLEEEKLRLKTATIEGE